MLSRSFSVPKETVGPDPIGDVSMRSAGDEASDEDADMGEQPAAENTDIRGPVDVTQPDETLEQEDDAEEDDGESDDDEGSEADAEEEVMVPVADILNAAYDLDNVSSFPKRPDAS